jgi:epoxyqueuosine reductase
MRGAPDSASRVVLDPGRGGGPPGSQASQYTLPAFEPRPDSNPLDVIPLFDLDDDAFRACFRHTPLWRAKRRGLLRNAAIVLGNRPTPAALPALCTGLHDIEPLVRAACAWALGRYTEPRARQVLEERLRIEADVEVCREITAALTQATVSEQN